VSVRVYRTKKRRRGRRFAALGVVLLVLTGGALAWRALGSGKGPEAAKTAVRTPSPTPRATPTASPTQSSAPAAPDFFVAAWSRGDLISLRRAVTAEAVNEVDLDWWHQSADGSLVPELVNPAFVAEAHQDHLQVFATITNRRNDTAPFDAAIAEAILATQTTRAASVARLVALCRSRGYDGIDLDWESLRAGDRSAFSAYVRQLGNELHAAGLRLSIAVYAKASDHPPGPEAGAMAAEDYGALGQAVDEFKLMTYSEHNGYTGPGAISSPAYMASTLAYAERQVPARKIWLGVAFFGLDWGSGVRYLLWSEAEALLAATHAPLQRSVSGEALFRYTVGRVTHTVYFQDRPAVASVLRFAAAQRPRVAGVAIWVMGGEDPGFWSVVHGAL
jgi:spore germination protein